ncbi:uncharacterized protein MYCFIDRAFT_211467, partial [Pseudocercospora fijiensis CIRAD86]
MLSKYQFGLLHDHPGITGTCYHLPEFLQARLPAASVGIRKCMQSGKDSAGCTTHVHYFTVLRNTLMPRLSSPRAPLILVWYRCGISEHVWQLFAYVQHISACEQTTMRRGSPIMRAAEKYHLKSSSHWQPQAPRSAMQSGIHSASSYKLNLVL